MASLTRKVMSTTRHTLGEIAKPLTQHGNASAVSSVHLPPLLLRAVVAVGTLLVDAVSVDSFILDSLC